ncbi:O-antigen polymerase [Enterococcus casseliflavus]|uniref:O-antigen polymerase n=1 Tax=Enterococcus casseliflavus TaxID=37734 RepID=UPI0018840FEE|nr:O-antigen polymerase [Enterococcus casseliflavus]MBE9906803.1 oligosaccharide repeat unit polymerase [Enterococcus casseliflavus]
MKKNISVFLFLFVYIVALITSYLYFVSPLFSYMGLRTDVNMYKLFLGLVAIVFIYFLIDKNNKASNQLSYLLFINSVIPGLIIGGLANYSYKFYSIYISAYFLLYLLLKILPTLKIKTIRLSYFSEDYFIYGLVFITFLILSYQVFISGGPDLRAFSSDDLYELRSELNLSGVMAYLINWLGKLFIPILLVYAIYYKKPILAIVAVLFQILLFSTTGQKTLLFSIALIVIGIFLVRINYWYKGLPLFYTFCLLVSAIFYTFFNSIFGIGMFSVRQSALPQYISSKYIDFFAQNQYLNFSEGMIGSLFNIKEVYSIPIANIISGNMLVNENTGFISDAFSNGGYIAVYIFILLAVFLFKYMDSLTHSSKNGGFYVCLMLYPIIFLNDSSLLTLLLTHGLFLLLIYMYLLRSLESQNKI